MTKYMVVRTMCESNRMQKINMQVENIIIQDIGNKSIMEHRLGVLLLSNDGILRTSIYGETTQTLPERMVLRNQLLSLYYISRRWRGFCNLVSN